MSTIQYIALFTASFCGGGLAYYFQRNNENVLKTALAFSGAYLLGVTFLHLLPEAYAEGGANIGFLVLGGFILQIFLDQFSQGVEHGHIHAAHHAHSGIAISLIFGIGLHALLEGLPLDGFAAHQNHPHNQLLVGVLMHKPPETFALTLLLLQSGLSKQKAFLYLLFFSLITPFGAYIGYGLEAQHWLDGKLMVYIMAVVIGTFFHIATTILFESEPNAHHHISLKRFLPMLLGIGIAMLTMH